MLIEAEETSDLGANRALNTEVITVLGQTKMVLLNPVFGQ